MTFDEWWDRYSHELPNPEFVSRENHRLMLEQAYEAGEEKGYDDCMKGDNWYWNL